MTEVLFLASKEDVQAQRVEAQLLDRGHSVVFLSVFPRFDGGISVFLRQGIVDGFLDSGRRVAG
jgi:hypothetical protein